MATSIIHPSSDDEGGKVNLGRHQAQCAICNHPDREQIEYEWVNWGRTSYIAECYRVSRYGLYRHAHALDLFSKRERNIKGALEKIIERMDVTDMSGGTILGAIKLYLSLIKPPDETPQVEGQGATPPHSPEGPQETQVTENTKLQ